MTLFGNWPLVLHCCTLAVALSFAISGSVVWRGDAAPSQSLTAQILNDLDKGNEHIRYFHILLDIDGNTLQSTAQAVMMSV